MRWSDDGRGEVNTVLSIDADPDGRFAAAVIESARVHVEAGVPA